ncbi:glutaredoxin domain-containing protein [Clostridium sp. UBA4548]|uniref:glutaredoxin domain-containing protein n=1 Tax=Clostridium sp. UBA4548 TaxID=1946361 RepID=UPI0025C01928|nr:glutaredoxin domain-containing protein [Clostridium sp. UBA4548]
MNITVYSTNTCPWCVKVKEYLKENDVSFKEVNVAEDRVGAMEMVKKSGQMGVPVLDLNGTIVIGFDKEKIDLILNLK